MGQAAAVTAHHEGELGGGALGGLGDDLVLVALRVLDGVPMDIQDKLDGRVLGESRLDGGQRPVIGPGVAGVVVEGPVVEDRDARLLQLLRHDIPGGDHVVAAVGAAVVAGVEDVGPRGGGVAFAAVAVEDQHLGPGLVAETGGEGPSRLGGGEGVRPGGVDVGKARDGVALLGGGDQGPGGDAVVCGGLHRHRGLPDGLRSRDGDGGVRRLRPVPAGAELRHRLPGGEQQGGLPQGQHRRDAETVPAGQVPQLPAQQGHRQLPPQGLGGAFGTAGPGGDAGCPERRPRQSQRPQTGCPSGMFHRSPLPSGQVYEKSPAAMTLRMLTVPVACLLRTANTAPVGHDDLGVPPWTG